MTRRIHRDDRGTSLVEFSLLLPVLLLLILGTINVALAVWQENTLAYAAREGTRYAIVHGSATPLASDVSDWQNTAAIVDTVKRAAVGVANVSVTVSYPDMIGTTPCNDRGCRVSVDATAPFIPLGADTLTKGALRLTLRGGSLLVIQQ